MVRTYYLVRLYEVRENVMTGLSICYIVKKVSLYRMSIKSFFDNKHLLQENYCTWNTNIFFFKL